MAFCVLESVRQLYHCDIVLQLNAPLLLILFFSVCVCILYVFENAMPVDDLLTGEMACSL